MEQKLSGLRCQFMQICRKDTTLPHPRKLSSPQAQTLREDILKELGL